MTADNLETDVCCFFVIVASRLDYFCKHNTLKEEVIMLFDSRTVYLGASRDKYEPVSYTHLTLPTIYSV